MSPKKILIVSGEPSGDLYASNLVQDLKRMKQDIQFFGLGGSLSKKAGVDVVFDITHLALVGFVEVIKNIFTVGRAYKAVIRKIDAERPDLAILVDYPGFNLRLAGELKKRSIPVVYYISPQVWAWGRDRVGIIKKCVKKIIVFFKFEEDLYKTYNIDALFVGHPLLDTVRATLSKGDTLKKYALAEGKATIALLPGSRINEIKSLFPVIISAAKLIKERLKEAQFILSKHPDLPLELYEGTMKASGLDIKIAEADTYNVLGASDFAIVTSGTATLESAIMGTPLVIIYKVNLLTYMLYTFVSQVQFLGLVNIIAGKEIAPEFLQFHATPENIANKIADMLRDKNKLAEIREDLRNVKSALGHPGASRRTAEAIISLLK